MKKTVRREFSKVVNSDSEARRFLDIFNEYGALALAAFENGKQATLSLNQENIERFVNYQSSLSGWTADTEKSKRRNLESFLNYFGSRPLSLIFADDMANWCRHVSGKSGKKRRYETSYSTLSVDTVRKYLADLRQFVRWARLVEKAALPDLPCELFKLKAKGKTRGNQYTPQALTLTEFSRIVRRLHGRYPHVAAVVRGVFLFGARPAQLFALSWDDVALPSKKDFGKVDLQACKGGVESSVVVEYGSKKHQLLLDCKALFKSFRGRRAKRADKVFVSQNGRSTSGGWTSQSFAGRLRACCRKVQVKDFVVYKSRHTSATLLQQVGGIGLGSIQATLQHSRVTTQENYSHRFSSDALAGREQLEKLMPVLEPVEVPENMENDDYADSVSTQDIVGEGSVEDNPEDEGIEGDSDISELFDL